MTIALCFPPLRSKLPGIGGRHLKRFIILVITLAAALPDALAQTVQWTPYTSAKEYRFSVSFCGAPSSDPPTVEKKGDKIGTVRLFTARTDNCFCMVGISDYNFKPDVEAELLLNQTNFIKAVKGTLGTSRRGGFAYGEIVLPTLTFTFEMPPNHTGKSIVILNGNRVYQLVFTYRKNTEYSDAQQTFLRSFEIR
jgi:hypothetical protein